MNSALQILVVQEQSLNLPYVSIEGAAPRDGHGFLSRQENDLTLIIFGSNGTIVDLRKDLRIKAETPSGEILIIEGRPHAITSGRYPRVRDAI